ncbi:molybdenum ABC transporter ATP-binding protein [Thalassospira alkalitolerans]|uniref:molybdenum ABC transporter ATP-binding protein n=1 Tax=Thalassospira alkalitolerans TaxID=1293890 RepID=UPI003AA7DDEA
MSIAVDIHHKIGTLDLHAAFDIAEPGITALFGPSGSGKTTIINAIAGLLRPDHGRIVIHDRAVFDRERHINLAPRKRRVGYVFQDARLFPHLSVKANLFYGHKRSDSPLTRSACDDVIAMLGIGDLLSRRPNLLSGGEKQRVSLGRALLANPEILLLDEPLSALDQARKNEILPYLEHLRDTQHLPILYVSHAIDEVARLADQMVVMEDGKTLASGSVFDMLGRTDLGPLAGQFDTGTVLPAKVVSRDPKSIVSFLECSGQRFVVPFLGKRSGSLVRLHIRARDVMIARAAPPGISANNILPTRIMDIARNSGDTLDITLGLGHGDGDGENPRTLHARITAWSAARLKLAIGQDVFAVIKSVTVDGHMRQDGL